MIGFNKVPKFTKFSLFTHVLLLEKSIVSEMFAFLNQVIDYENYFV